MPLDRVRPTESLPDPTEACAPCPLHRLGLCAADRVPLVMARHGTPARTRLRPGDAVRPGAATWVVLSGLLRVQRHDAEGRRRIVGLVVPGDVIHDEFSRGSDIEVEAATVALACRVDRAAFDRLLDSDPDLRHALVRQRLAKLDRLRWLTWSLGALQPEERVCAFLALATAIMPFRRLPGGEAMLTVTLPRTDVADLLGTTAESICRIARRLRDRGLVRMPGPSRFVILDDRALIRAGCLDGLLDALPAGPGSPLGSCPLAATAVD